LAPAVDPGIDLNGVETEKVSPLDVGDAAFRHEAPHVPHFDPEPPSYRLDVDQLDCRPMRRRILSAAGLTIHRRSPPIVTEMHYDSLRVLPMP